MKRKEGGRRPGAAARQRETETEAGVEEALRATRSSLTALHLVWTPGSGDDDLSEDRHKVKTRPTTGLDITTAQDPDVRSRRTSRRPSVRTTSYRPARWT
jgi:hypothetical protein